MYMLVGIVLSKYTNKDSREIADNVHPYILLHETLSLEHKV